MADPLSVSKSTASLAIQVVQGLLEFYNAYKNRDSEVKVTTEKLENLSKTLMHLEKALGSHGFSQGEVNLVRNIEASMTRCKQSIDELQDDCTKFKESSATGLMTAVKSGGGRISYPFRRSTILKINENISDINGDFVRISLTYLLDENLTSSQSLASWYQKGSSSEGTSFHEEFPFAKFASTYWLRCYRTIQVPDPDIEDLILEFFQNHDSIRMWSWMCDILFFSYSSYRADLYHEGLQRDDQDDEGYPIDDRYYEHLQIYLVSVFGLDKTLSRMIDKERANDEEQVEAMVGDGRDLGSVQTSHEKIEARRKKYTFALTEASATMHEQWIPRMIDARAGYYFEENSSMGEAVTASWEGYEKVIDILIGAGAEVNAPATEVLETPLQATLLVEHKELMWKLLMAGADVNAPGCGDTGNALSIASSRGSEELVLILIEAGGNVNASDAGGPALCAAAVGNHEKVARLLLDAGAKVDEKDQYGLTALYYATKLGHAETVQVLLNAKANPRTRYMFLTRGRYLEEANPNRERFMKTVQVLRKAGVQV